MTNATVGGQALVDRLRNDELRSIQNDIETDLRDQILKALDERGSAQELIRQQYTGRYPFELLQNANDASVDSTGERKIVFAVSDTALVVADQGSGFGADQIRAICRLGRSSKDPRKSIGYKGLGFKSVGEITDCPQIVSRDVAFGFDTQRTRGAVQALTGPVGDSQRLPVYAFPFPLRTEDLAGDAELVRGLREQGFVSILRLPFRSGVERSAVELHLRDTINPRLLLFLDASDSLELKGTSADFAATVVRSNVGDSSEVLLQSAPDRVEHWLVFRRGINDLDRGLVDPLGDPWKFVAQVHVAAAVPLTERGTPGGKSAEPLHVYFPTEEATGLPTIVHGDFALELDRRHVGRSAEMFPYNDWLAKQLADLVADVAEELASRYPRQASVVSCFAPVAPASGFGAELLARCLARLRRAKFIPVVSGSSVAPTDAVLLPATVPSAERAHQFLELSAQPTIVLPSVEIDHPGRRLLADALGTPEMTTAAALALLREPPPSEDRDLYDFLVAWREAEDWQFPKLLSGVRCVRVLGRGWLAPAAKVFFARQREEVEFPEGLQVPIADVPEVEGLRELLEAAGVRPFEWRQLIPEFVLPLLTDPSALPDSREAALLALRKYYEAERTGDPRIRSQVAQVLVPARDANGARLEMRPAKAVYFSSGWLGHDRLERVYGAFDSAEFLALEAPKEDAERKREMEFYEWVGLSRYPRSDEVRETHALGFLSRHPHRAYGKLWETWQAAVLDAVRVCVQGHSTSQQLRSSFALDRFPDLVASADRDRLRLLWIELALSWGHYESAMSSDVYCDHGWHSGGDRTRTVPSFMRFLLSELEWVPAIRRRAPILTRARMAWRVTLETPRPIVERVPVLDPGLDVRASAQMVASLDVVDAARPGVNDLATLLRQVAQDFADTPEDDRRGLQLAARWAMRTLNDALDGTVPVGPIPLLARYDGSSLFVEHPFVATDPLLKETWEPVFPILDADQDLRRLHQALHLRILDNEVHIQPEPRRPRPDRQAELEAWIHDAKPYLAAIAIEQVPSREDDIVRGLSRLEVIVCDELVLRYELDGQTRARDEAVSFIAVRVVQEGSFRRRFGTAHLELDPKTGFPRWFVFGPQLAVFVGVPNQADAFALVLAATKSDRELYLAARRISPAAVELARVHLAETTGQEFVDDLLQYEKTGVAEAGEAGGSVQSETQEAAATAAPSEDEDEKEIARPERKLPPLEFDLIAMTDAPRTVGANMETGGEPTSRAQPGLGPLGPIDHERQQAVQRRIGLRGEEAAYQAERRRLLALGQDPSVVVWTAKDHELAPYDIESLDDDGQRIFIEVKATTSADPFDPFEISEAELLFAIDKRTRYYIYRVTEAHEASPAVLRFQDPVGRLHDNAAKLRLSGARMSFVRGANNSLVG